MPVEPEVIPDVVPQGEDLTTDTIQADNGTEPGQEPDASGNEPVVEDSSALDELANSYGLSTEELSGFSSVEDAKRALSMIDRQFAQTGNAAMRDYYESRQQQQPQQPQQPQPPPQTGLNLEEWDEDDPIRGNFNSLNNQLAALQQSITTLASYQYQQSQAARVAEFHSHLDALNLPEYGQRETMTDAQLQRRANIGAQYDAIEMGMSQRGLQVPGMKQMIARTIQYLGQSSPQTPKPKKHVTLGKPGRGTPAVKIEDWNGPMEDHPAVKRLYNELSDPS